MADSSDVVAGTNATATQYNNLREDLVLGQKVTGTDTDGSTITVDWSDKTKGNVRTVTLGAAGRTLAFSNVTVGQVMTIRLVQDGTGNRTITTWPTTIKWPGGSAPTLSTAAAAVDVLIFMCTGSGTYDAYFVGFSLS